MVKFNSFGPLLVIRKVELLSRFVCRPFILIFLVLSQLITLSA